MIEDKLFVPAVRHVEQQIKQSGPVAYTDMPENETPDRDKLEVLSDREKDIVVCVTKGMNNKEIADYLFLSVHTVTTHRRNISLSLIHIYQRFHATTPNTTASRITPAQIIGILCFILYLLLKNCSRFSERPTEQVVPTVVGELL